MEDSLEQVIITKKTPLQNNYTKLIGMFAIFYSSTMFLLIAFFYQIVTSQKFWEQNIVLLLFVVGLYGFALTGAGIIRLLINEYGGALANHYKKYEFYYSLVFISIVTLSLLAIFYFIFGLGAIGPIIGSIAALGIKTWIERKLPKQSKLIEK